MGPTLPRRCFLALCNSVYSPERGKLFTSFAHTDFFFKLYFCFVFFFLRGCNCTAAKLVSARQVPVSNRFGSLVDTGGLQQGCVLTGSREQSAGKVKTRTVKQREGQIRDVKSDSNILMC